MGLGEYTSVRTQNDQVAHEVEKERRELERNPDAEAEELAQRWIERGLPADLAREVAAALATNPDEALRVHAQEELGVDPDELPSPWVAALLVVHLLLDRRADSAAAVPVRRDEPVAVARLGGVGLFVAGALTARFTSQTWWYSGGRQLLLGAVAAAATYGIGHLIGVGVS